MTLHSPRNHLTAMPSRYPFAFLLFLTAFCPTSVRGVALSLLSGTSTQGSLLSLNVVLNSVAGSEPAALQWTINYPASNISSILIAPGPQATSASKSLTCRNIYGSESCLLSGLNTNRIPNGVVAVATLQLSPSTVGVPPGIELIKALGVSSFNASIPVATTTSITVATPIPQVKALQCSPTSVTGPAVETCTVTLTASAPSPGVNVSIGTAATSVTITNPGSVTVPAGQTIAVFSLNVSGAITASTVLVTGSENGSSAVASFTVTPPASSLPSIMGLQCFPFFVTAPATVNCTVTLTASAPSPGLSLSIGLAATGVTITNPDSVIVPAGQTSTAFSLNVIGATTVSTVMVTASESGSSSVASFSVTPPEISLPSTIRVLAGGLGYVDGDGNIWAADEGYSGGSTYGTSAPISATSSPYLYQTERFASGTLH